MNVNTTNGIYPFFSFLMVVVVVLVLLSAMCVCFSFRCFEFLLLDDEQPNKISQQK